MADDITRKWRMTIPGLGNHALPGDNVPETFDVLSVSHGLNYDPGYGGQSPRTHVQELALMRAVDAATPVFFKLCATADPMPLVKLELTAWRDNVEISRMEYELVDARVSSVHTGGSAFGGDPAMSESLMLRFEKLRMRVVQGGHTGHVQVVPPSN
ncbi:MAG: type VI secretion system tube protein Hcp [Planctomycetes bacterium]|jgi:type VI protein secretion system component Hcp|nr:type VI secretion system tube protein Hcp [Planctomycetota bacterium]